MYPSGKVLYNRFSIVVAFLMLRAFPNNAQSIPAEWHYHTDGNFLTSGIVDADEVYHVPYHDYVGYISHVFLLSVDSSGNEVSKVLLGDFQPKRIDKRLNTYGSGPDFFSNKIYSYDSNGLLRWEIDNPICPSGDGVPLKMLTDDSGNLYAISNNTCTDIRISVTKIDSFGNVLWTTYPNPNPDEADHFQDAALSKEGDLFLTGDFTARIRDDGSVAWFLDMYGETIAVDDSGNNYISNGLDKIQTTKIAPDGTVKWDVLFNANPALKSRIALDGDNNVIVLYTDNDTVLYSPHLIKYDNSGNELWTAQFTNLLPDYYSETLGLAIDSADDIAITMYAYPDAPYGDYYGYLTAKYSTDGNLKWYSLYELPYDHWYSNYLQDIKIDIKNNIWVAGESYTEGDEISYFDIFRFDGLATTVYAPDQAVISIWPNPFREGIQVNTSQFLPGSSIEVYDMMGRQVLAEKISAASCYFSFSHASSGVYLAIIKQDSHLIFSMKIVAE
ncbi:MAG: T9SS type A sorting domain-containing protein [Chitinophagaceae bacterium]|nr:T9SS type A sorting domain-containing protein [Chitinophagaceae bacterium]